MAKNRRSEPTGAVGPGWTRLNLTVPRDLAAIFRAEAKMRGEVKVLGTAAIAVILALPEEERNALCRWIAHESWDRPERITPEGAIRAITAAVHTIRGDDTDLAWFMSSLVDPELWPRPGEKASDKARRDKDTSEEEGNGGELRKGA